MEPKSIRNILLYFLLTIFCIFSTWSIIKSFQRQSWPIEVKNSSYINRDIGIAFDFPAEWHPILKPDKNYLNILVAIHKENYSKNIDKSKIYPYIVFASYDVKKYFFKSISKMSDDLLEQEFKAKSVSSYKIINKQILKRGFRSTYEVIYDITYLDQYSIKVSAIFIKKGSLLFCLAFNDMADDFDKNIHFFNEIKNSFRII